MSLSRVIGPVAAEPNRMIRSGRATPSMRRTISRTKVSSMPINHMIGDGARTSKLVFAGVGVTRLDREVGRACFGEGGQTTQGSDGLSHPHSTIGPTGVVDPMNIPNAAVLLGLA